MEISQRTNFLNQLKSKPFDPKDRIQADTEVRTRQEAMHQGALELRKLVDEIHEKYAAVGKDAQVKKWLDTPEGHAGVKPKLGPSRTFLARREDAGADRAGVGGGRARRGSRPRRPGRAGGRRRSTPRRRTARRARSEHRGRGGPG